jgi:hypothetical protein
MNSSIIARVRRWLHLRPDERIINVYDYRGALMSLWSVSGDFFRDYDTRRLWWKRER